MKKKYPLEDKKLRMAYVWFSNYVGTLDKFVDEYDDIYLYDTLEQNYAKILIVKSEQKCVVETMFWDFFSKKFNLEKNEVILLISHWYCNVFNVENVHVTYDTWVALLI